MQLAKLYLSTAGQLYYMDEAVDLSLSSHRLTNVSNEGFEINPSSEHLIHFTSFEEWQKQEGLY